jgi:AraC-like DNA-binding protein
VPACDDGVDAAHTPDLSDAYQTEPSQVEEAGIPENLIALRRQLRDRFAGKVVRMHPAPVEVASSGAKLRDQVRRVIEIRLADEELGVQELARLVAHSRRSHPRWLPEITDESRSDLLRRMRRERAAQLLEAGAGSVSEVAYGVGFKSVAHFSNRFQYQFGVRPSRTASRWCGDGHGLHPQVSRRAHSCAPPTAVPAQLAPSAQLSATSRLTRPAFEPVP